MNGYSLQNAAEDRPNIGIAMRKIISKERSQRLPLPVEHYAPITMLTQACEKFAHTDVIDLVGKLCKRSH